MKNGYNVKLVSVSDTLSAISNDIKQLLINQHTYNNLENEKPVQQRAYSSVHKIMLESII